MKHLSLDISSCKECPYVKDDNYDYPCCSKNKMRELHEIGLVPDWCPLSAKETVHDIVESFKAQIKKEIELYLDPETRELINESIDELEIKE